VKDENKKDLKAAKQPRDWLIGPPNRIIENNLPPTSDIK
jgi:hypothetical protein